MFSLRRMAGVAALCGLAPLAATLFGGSEPGTSTADAAGQPLLTVLASYKTDSGFETTGAEIVAYDDGFMYVVNGDKRVIEKVSIHDPAHPRWIRDIDITPYGADVTSVAVRNGVVVAAVPAGREGEFARTQPGKAVFFDTSGNLIRSIPVGSLPDMVTFSPNGSYVLVANEGEPSPDYTLDPEGSVTIIDVSDVLSGRAGRLAGRTLIDRTWPLPVSAVRTVGFSAFNVGGARHGELPANVRIFGPGASVAQDLEPEYISLSADSTKAYVTLQENDAVAVIDMASAMVDSIIGLGYKDHSLAGNRFDSSDRFPDQNNPVFNLQNWPVLGMYQPDGIAGFEVGGQQYFVTANEGDAREYGSFVEAQRLRDATGGSGVAPLCPDVFPNASALRDNAALGRLNITTKSGLRTTGANAPCFEKIYSFGARSFSIWKADGTLVFDSGEQLEQRTNDMFGDFVNSNHSANAKKNRSDDKGPEPEGVAIGVVNGVTYAFIGLERMGGVMVYDVTNPASPSFVQYLNNRNFAQTPPGPDAGAEGVTFVRGISSPTGKPLVLVANEVSGTVTIFEFN